VPASVTVAAGASTAMFTVSTLRPNRNRSVVISAKAGTQSVGASLTVTAR
jgi:hypothetical protein